MGKGGSLFILGRVEVNYEGNEGKKIHSLFNIPINWSPLVFSRILSNSIPNIVAGKSDGIHMVNKNERLHVESNFEGNSGSRKISYYVFVPAKHIPLPKYGLIVKNDIGNICFHSGRRALNVKDLLKKTNIGASGVSTTYSYNVAAQTTLTGAARIPISPYQSFGYYRTTLGSGRGIHISWFLVESSSNPYPETSTFITASVPLINADEYHDISSLHWI
ncbi:hypothetical protein [Photobacterium damselae]|uniref:hypothetical protein n=1 Tax=Photobacterium damselae TaxID=38293 RepID=UPI001F4235E1|nr:hypothetical protein [Photobacterium damselae]UKA03861.1 hypothetical protein IHC89_15140 [Photobacterium damselae subsp. damselae]